MKIIFFEKYNFVYKKKIFISLKKTFFHESESFRSFFNCFLQKLKFSARSKDILLFFLFGQITESLDEPEE